MDPKVDNAVLRKCSVVFLVQIRTFSLNIFLNICISGEISVVTMQGKLLGDMKSHIGLVYLF